MVNYTKEKYMQSHVRTLAGRKLLAKIFVLFHEESKNIKQRHAFYKNIKIPTRLVIILISPLFLTIDLLFLTKNPA